MRQIFPSAQLGSAFLGANLHIDGGCDHAGIIAGVLKNFPLGDTKEIFVAASKASEAADSGLSFCISPTSSI